MNVDCYDNVSLITFFLGINSVIYIVIVNCSITSLLLITHHIIIITPIVEGNIVTKFRAVAPSVY